MKIDCKFIYFKPSGKFYTEGIGQFPNTPEQIYRKMIMQWNAGKMPGILGEAKEFVIVVIPDGDCKSDYAFPRMIKEEK